MKAQEKNVPPLRSQQMENANVIISYGLKNKISANQITAAARNLERQRFLCWEFYYG